MTLRFYIRLAEIALTLLLATAVILSWREARSDRAELKTQLAAANQALAAATGRQQDRDAKLTDVLAGIAAEKKAAATPDQLVAGIAAAIGLPTPLQLQGADVLAAKSASVKHAAGNHTTPNPLRNSSPGPGKPAAPSVTTEPSSNGQDHLADATATGGSGPAPHDANPNSAPFSTLARQSGGTTSSATQPLAPDAKIPSADLRPLYDYILDCKSCQAKLTAVQADLLDEKSKTTILTKSRDDAVRAAKGGSLWKRTLRAAKWFAIGVAAGAIAAKSAR